MGSLNMNANLWRFFFPTFAVLRFTNFIPSAASPLAIGLNTRPRRPSRGWVRGTFGEQNISVPFVC